MIKRERVEMIAHAPMCAPKTPGVHARECVRVCVIARLIERARSQTIESSMGSTLPPMDNAVWMGAQTELNRDATRLKWRMNYVRECRFVQRGERTSANSDANPPNS